MVPTCCKIKLYVYLKQPTGLAILKRFSGKTKKVNCAHLQPKIEAVSREEKKKEKGGRKVRKEDVKKGKMERKRGRTKRGREGRKE